jgi:2-oxoglutarate dehydrogenase E2 component (dihydrolipoamide succinyltransferase)
MPKKLAPARVVAKQADPKPADPKPADAKPIVTATNAAPAPAAPAPAPAVAPAPAPTPPPIEPMIAQLSNATISAVASDHARQLSKCENGTDLHGDVSVAFQIDGSGRVVKSQMSSTISNTKVAACILAAVRSWAFPKPPAGAAKGVYSINYQ